MEPVVITGLGVVSCLGNNPDVVFDAIVAGRCGARDVPAWHGQGLRTTHAALVDREPVWASLAPQEAGLPWASAMGLVAARAALVDAGRSPVLGEVALLASNSIGAPSAAERAGGAWRDVDPADPEMVARYAQGSLVALLAASLGARGVVRAFVTTCAGGNYAIGAALDALRRGEADVALAGGLEEVSTAVYAAFNQLRAIGEVCRPFDAQRSGLLFGEGAAFLVLERESVARARGARIRGCVLGVGYSNDAHHLVAPDPEGRGATLAMRRALDDGGISPGEVTYVNAHGTGTQANDAVEGKAIATALGAGAPEVVVSSTKGATGHLMGAASALEAVITAIALERRVVPPNVGVQVVDPEVPVRIATRAEAMRGTVALSNGFGFGGNNAVLALCRSARATAQPLRRSVFVVGGVGIAGDEIGAASLCARFAAATALEESARRITREPAELLGKKGLRHVDRSALLLSMALAAEPDAWCADDAERTGAVVGSAFPAYPGVIAMMREFQSLGAAKMNPALVPSATANCAASFLLLRRGGTGLNASVASGECAGLDAVIYAAEAVALGRVDTVLAGGSDAWVDELWRAIELGRWWTRPLAEAAAALVLSSRPERAYARVVDTATSFDRDAPELALQRCVEQLLTRQHMPLVDVIVTPRAAALGVYANHLWDLGPVFGECLAGGSALAALVGAGALRPGARQATHVVVACEARDGYASAVLFEALRPA